ncbi:MAG: SH3 domain-containing protein [Deltaproteobacteria bacterium]|nr:SH3 domain-containing protein [Deltaproteobacteria bacterium]
MLIAAIVLLIVIFGAPIAYRMLDEGRRGEGPGAGSPAQEAISHDRRGKISEKIVKESTPAGASTEAVSPAETSPLERSETPTTEKVDQETGAASGPQDMASLAGADVARRDSSEPAEIKPTPESSDGVDREKSPDEAAGTADAAAEEPSGEKTSETHVLEAKPPEAPDDTPSTTDESGPVDKNGASQPEAVVETVVKGDPVPPDNREVIVEMGNVRDGPSIEAEVKFRIKRGDTLTVLEQHGNWYAIELQDGRSGWAHNTLFSRKTQAAEKGSGRWNNTYEGDPGHSPRHHEGRPYGCHI